MVKYPQMRAILKEIVQYLADKEYQQRLWIRRTQPFDMTVDFFHDIDQVVAWLENIGAFDYVDGMEGDTLKNRREVEAVRAVTQALDKCIDALGLASNEDYIEYPGWEEVISTAQAAHTILTDS